MKEEIEIFNDIIYRTSLVQFEDITKRMTDLYYRKNADYGNSFDKSMDDFGITVAAVRLGDKYNRLKSLIKNKEAKVKDESIKDTLIDLANYSVMTLMWLENESKGL